jgi:hypothetical protein
VGSDTIFYGGLFCFTERDLLEGGCITPRKGSIQFRLLRKRLAGAPNPSVPV